MAAFRNGEFGEVELRTWLDLIEATAPPFGDVTVIGIARDNINDREADEQGNPVAGALHLRDEQGAALLVEGIYGFHEPEDSPLHGDRIVIRPTGELYVLEFEEPKTTSFGVAALALAIEQSRDDDVLACRVDQAYRILSNTIASAERESLTPSTLNALRKDISYGGFLLGIHTA